MTLPLREDFEYGVLSLEGELDIEGDAFAANELAYLGRGRASVTLSLPAGGHAILVGGEPLGEEILIWWNFVGHSREEIVQASATGKRAANVSGSSKAMMVRADAAAVAWRRDPVTPFLLIE